MTWIIQKHNVISVVIALLLADSPSPYKTTRLVSHCAHQQSRNVHSVWLGRDVAMKYFPVCGYRLLLLLLVRRSLNWARRSKSLPDLIWHRRGTTSPASLIWATSFERVSFSFLPNRNSYAKITVIQVTSFCFVFLRVTTVVRGAKTIERFFWS